LFERTCVFIGIQFTKHFIGFDLVETNQFFDSNSNVILTWQTCGHRSSRVAGSKHQALAFYPSVRFWYVLLVVLKCRGESGQGLCVSSVLANRMRLRSADSWFKNVFGRRIRRKSALRTRILIASSHSKGHSYSNLKGYLVESSLNGILLNCFLWKRTNWSVVIQTWFWHGKPAASARAGLREVNAGR